jgi:hypothetical protein
VDERCELLVLSKEKFVFDTKLCVKFSDVFGKFNKKILNQMIKKNIQTVYRVDIKNKKNY